MKRSDATNRHHTRRSSNRTTRWALALGAALLCLLLAGSAWALSLEDVKKMAGSLDDNTIISIIENSGDRFQIDEATEAELKEAGLSDRVINALKATAPSADGDGTGDTTGGGGPTPVPAGSGNLGKLMAQGARMAKQQYDIASAAAKKLKQQKEMEKRSAEMSLDFQGVEQITSDFEDADKWKALAVCHNFQVKYNLPIDTDEGYEASWCKGAAFHALGLHNLAAPILREVTVAGSERPRFASAFNALADSAEAAGYFPASLAELDELYIEDQPREVQDRFNYFMGRFFGNVLSNYDRGIELLTRVSTDGDWGAKARYATGVMHLGNGAQAQAATSFEEAIIAAEANPDGLDTSDVIELAYLGLARIFYEVGQYTAALYYYNKIDRFSTRYPQALFEMGWAYFQSGDTRNALGTFHSVSSPYYEGYYFPDLWVMEATVYLNACRYELAKEALATFKATYLNKLPLLSQFLLEQENPSDYYTKLVAMLENRESGNTELPEIFLEAVLSDIEFYNLYKVVSQIEREVEILSNVSGQLGAYGEELTATLQQLREKRLLEAGLKTQGVLKKIEDELNEWDVTSTEVSIEIDIAEKELDERCLQLAAQGKPCEFEAEEQTVLFLVADDWQFWPFEGEYWVDEVGNYKSYLGDRCRQVEAVAEGDVEE